MFSQKQKSDSSGKKGSYFCQLFTKAELEEIQRTFGREKNAGKAAMRLLFHMVSLDVRGEVQSNFLTENV